MKEDELLSYLSDYRDLRSQRKRFLFWASLAIHFLILAALVVTPLTRVDQDLPAFESISTFLVRPPSPPPQPPPPPPPRAVSSSGPRKPPPNPTSGSQFVAPVAVPISIPSEEFEAGFSLPEGVAGGVPGGVAGGIVGGLADTAKPPSTSDEPIRLDFRTGEARPELRVEPTYPQLAAQAHVQGAVVLEVLVGADGAPERIDVLRSVPLLEAAAIQAVRQWRWRPLVRLGRAVPFRVMVTVSFRLT